MDQLNGFIDTIVFASEETGFTVARLKAPKHQEPITVVGTMPGVNPGETLHCQGVWKHHAKHGRQFEVQQYELTAPVDVIGIQKYLESGMVKGVGPVYAKRIVDTFGVKTLEVIDKETHRLAEVEGLGAKRVEKIAQCWSEQKSVRNVMIFLQSHRVRPSFAQKIFKRYGEESIDTVKNNPYTLAREIRGVGFKTADELAQNLGIAKDSPIRIKAGIEYVLWELSSSGHVCYPKESFIPEAEAILEIEGPLIAEQLTALELEGHIMQEKLKGEDYIWVRPLYNAEWGVTRELKRLQEAPCKIRPVLVEKAVGWAEEKHRIRFAKEQKVAIAKSLEEKIHIITGGPGTGKSTITRAILSITSKVTDKITLAAPTGRAAKRMTEITGKKAFTIHSLLEFDFHEGGFKRNRDNPLSARLLIIDEASMIDTLLMYNLLKAIPDDTRVIFIGDIDQLPSVGPGNVLKDMIFSETLPVTRLKWIFRQGKGSRIVANAHRINAGYFPETEHEKGSDFIFFDAESPEEILAKIIDLIEHHIPEKFPFNPIDDIQVLSPMKRGVIGTDNLNHALQQRLNPQSLHLTRMGRHFNLHDKVMQTRNNYDKKVFNGDVGRITSIDLEAQELTVNFDGKEVIYDFYDIDELMLAYAVSIHKYQGSECPCVIIPVHTSHFKLLFRNLLYTGITRGKKLVVLLGTKKALAIAVKTDNVKTRHTGLQHFLSRETATV
ncbi:ATP-dependent RecD-like DNA helicase [Candidatus Neptunochlamydia vexilliferae]|uniref:ATP-dependent RecD2 DNA helicase n=1 Tax=Candidatus Neptunichlamydia vexilliferae TaxID=1651774 RepID=A0ABS0B057_9BACT|nr:ATP-dependent RecD-like DNA helicase [Candidatus Neptunochlamydia vexilliferae]MBF5059771.1 ATP-dependent RecD-like DNA helicase [Candidatus Neptunochlamydia vexilliferae]